MIVEPRVHIPEKIKAGDVVTIQAAISHPMRLPPGDMKDDGKKRKCKKSEANYIEFFIATFEGNTFFRTRFWSAISANPYLSFHLRVPGPGTLDLQWVDNSGRTWNLSRKLDVA